LPLIFIQIIVHFGFCLACSLIVGIVGYGGVDRSLLLLATLLLTLFAVLFVLAGFPASLSSRGIISRWDRQNLFIAASLLSLSLAVLSAFGTKKLIDAPPISGLSFWLFCIAFFLSAGSGLVFVRGGVGRELAVLILVCLGAWLAWQWGSLRYLQLLN